MLIQCLLVRCPIPSPPNPCPLLVQSIYEHHLNPKELLVKYDLKGSLRRLLQEGENGEMVLVAKMAQQMLSSLQINTVL